MFRADLHCHSLYSDGSLSPNQLIDLAKERNLQGLSLTDHDTFEGFFAGVAYAKEVGLRWMPGIEISTEFEGHNIHLLGYCFDVNDQELSTLCLKLKNDRKIRNRGILGLLAKMGISIDEEELLKIGDKGSVGRPHIAQILLQRGLVTSINQAFKKYLGEYKPAYYKTKRLQIEEAIKAIQKAGGLAVLAHPHLIRDINLVDKLLKLPLDGLESFYSRFPRSQEEKWIQIANDKGWIKTGGSDFHGAPKPEIRLGISWVGEETFNFMWDKWKTKLT